MTIETFTSQELYNFLIDYDKENPLEKLTTLEQEIKYFGDITPPLLTPLSEYIFFCVFDDDKIVGAAKLKIKGDSSIEHQDVKEWISFISVNPLYQKQGLSSIIIEDLIKYLHDNNYRKVIASGYTEDGLNYLRPKLISECDKYNIELLDKNEVEFIEL